MEGIAFPSWTQGSNRGEDSRFHPYIYITSVMTSVAHIIRLVKPSLFYFSGIRPLSAKFTNTPEAIHPCDATLELSDTNSRIS